MTTRAIGLERVGLPLDGMRRALLVGASAATVMGLGSAQHPALARPAPRDPRATAEGQVKLNATLDGTPAFWAYSGLIYAVRPSRRPLPILAICGCQANWAARQADGSFHLAAPLLSFFQSVDDHAFLERFDNPFTGRPNEVRPNLFAGSGRALYPADGSALRILGPIAATESAPQGFKEPDSSAAVGRVEWSLTRDTVVLTTDTFLDVKTQPQGEAQTRTASRTAFFDPRVARLAARFSATTISPWLKWMDMGETEGHLVWHTFGEKVFSMDEVSADYRRHAGALLDQLTTRPALEGPA